MRLFIKLLSAVFLLLVFASWLAGCHRNETEKVNKLIIVLCDISNSVTLRDRGGKGSLDIVRSSVRDIPNLLKGTGRIFYLPVSSNMNERPLPEDGIRQIRGNSADLMDQDTLNQRSLGGVCQTLDSLAGCHPTSCILSSIEHSYDLFQEKRQGGDSMDLVIISDMLEDCRLSPAGGVSLNLDNPQVVNALADKYKPNVSFQGLPLRVTIVNTAPAISDVELYRLTSLWRQLFKKMNYNGTVNIRTTLPDQL